MSKVSVRQAAKLTGLTRETINKDTNSGKLACSRNSRNHKRIDIAELERVYDLVKTMDEIEQESKAVKQRPPPSESDTSTEVATLREKLASSEQTVEMLKDERSRERRQLESEIENLRESLDKAQDQHSKALLLITDQSDQSKQRSDDWEAMVKGLEARLANNEREQEKDKLRISRLQRALKEKENQSIWKKLFS